MGGGHTNTQKDVALWWTTTRGNPTSNKTPTKLNPTCFQTVKDAVVSGIRKLAVTPGLLFNVKAQTKQRE